MAAPFNALPLQAILAQLREDDEMSQLAGLTELCEYLSISTGAAPMAALVWVFLIGLLG